MKKYRLLAVLAFASLALAQSNPVSVLSPDKNLEISFSTADSGQLVYSVSFEGKPLIARSKLGLALQGRPVLGEKVRITSTSTDGRDGTYHVIHGKSNPVRDHYNALRVELRETRTPPRVFTIEARAYNDGVAFRYLVPEQAQAKLFRLSDELTEFRIAKDSPSWPLLLRGFGTSYEDDYVTEPVSGIDPKRLIALPFLVHVPGVAWVAITEAHLEGYAGMYLKTTGRGGLKATLAPNPAEAGLKVLAQTPHASPWRVIMVGREVGRLIESNIIINLNPPCELKETSWIKPGKSVWDWWFGKVKMPEGFETGMNTKTFKYLIDFAAEKGFDYVLVDDGWSDRVEILTPKPDVDIREIIRYAKSKGIGVWLWLHWTGVDKYMNDAFPLFAKWGAVGLKIDFMDRDDQWMVDWYHRVVRTAAANHLMVDFHGAYKPTGMRRTLPNLMTREGVMGLEYTKWCARVNPAHNVMLPFTRLLAGPMDYTPGGFGNVTQAEFKPRFNDPLVMGTRAHQLAMFVVYRSPYTVACDNPAAYRAAPAFRFLQQVPVTWDETKVLNAQVGDYITIARRKGGDWYIGSMTNWTPRELSIPLRFLGAGEYTAEIYADAPDADRNPKHVSITRDRVTASTVLKVKLAPGGGNAIRITKGN